MIYTKQVAPFDELILSWNGPRPSHEPYLFHIRIKIRSWSPWILHASWGKNEQSSFIHSIDTLEVAHEEKATAFEVKVNKPVKMYVYTHGDQTPSKEGPLEAQVSLPVQGLSQMTLPHKRASDLCSPTATTAVLRYLLKNPSIDPLHFASQVWDKGADIFGNWVFNVAEAAIHLGPTWNVYVTRLKTFHDIYERLHENTPVIVSVRGPLPGSALPYAQGHLIAVIGFDPLTQRVLCMDPAFPSNEETLISYPLEDFMKAWERRGKIAYVFTSCHHPHLSPLDPLCFHDHPYRPA